MKTKKLLIVIIAFVALLAVLQTKSEAVLQSKPGATSLTNTISNEFFVLIRQMETGGGTLGLNAQLQETTYLDTSGNEIDCHMAKNTEWGTVAMLSASRYGLAPIGSSTASTTGNATGVYQMANPNGYEVVAGIFDISHPNVSTIKSADARYYNLYGSTSSIAGDATLETRNWKGASHSTSASSTSPICRRSFSSLFGYSATNGNGYDYDGSRAVVVVGAGL